MKITANMCCAVDGETEGKDHYISESVDAQKCCLCIIGRIGCLRDVLIRCGATQESISSLEELVWIDEYQTELTDLMVNSMYFEFRAAFLIGRIYAEWCENQQNQLSAE